MIESNYAAIIAAIILLHICIGMFLLPWYLLFVAKRREHE